jgi:hypothetical protein
MKRLIRSAMHAIGFDIVRYRPPFEAGSYQMLTRATAPIRLPQDLSAEDCAILERVAGYTMTSVPRQVALVQAVRYLVRQSIDGCFIECGVWRGGSVMAVALTLAQEGETNRDLYLYDTFEGMTPPTAVDRTADGTLAQTHLDRDVNKTGWWCVAGIDDVRQNMASTGYPEDRIHFVKGPVETTIPKHAPTGTIALL